MKTITKKLGTALMLLIVATSLSAQVRWNPADWNGTVDPTGKISVMTPGQVNADTPFPARSRGDFKLLADIKFVDTEPFYALMITTDNCSLDLLDWKFQVMCQRQERTGTQAGDGTWSYGAWAGVASPNFDTNKKRIHTDWDADQFELLGYENNLLEGDNPYSNRTSVFVIDLEKVQEGILLLDGSFSLPFINPFGPVTADGVKLQAQVDGEKQYQQRSWIETVTMAREGIGTPKYNLHYAATVEDPTDALYLIEMYKDGNGGKEVRDTDFEEDDTAVDEVKDAKISIWQNANKIIAPFASKLEVYSLVGTMVKSVYDSELIIEQPGVYVVKASKDQRSVTSKVIIR